MRSTFETLAKKRTEFWNKGTQKVLVENTAIRLRNLRCILSVNLNISPDNGVEVSKAVSLLARMRDALISMKIYHHTWDADDLLGWTTLLPILIGCLLANKMKSILFGTKLNF